jgi:DNA-binding response OmpR family regulator
MKLILCVEDEKNILNNNCKAFTDAGYTVLTAENMTQAKEHLDNHTPDAIVLDIMLPDGNGLDLLAELRGLGSKIPIIMLTAWGKPSDIAKGLKLGANDYLSKPFTYEVLLARVEAMFRNVEQMPERITRGGLSIDVLSRQAFINGVDMLLTNKELNLLILFVQHENRNIDAEYLYEKVWGQPMNDDTRALANMVYKLRKKLDGSGYDIKTEYGQGYCFEIE